MAFFVMEYLEGGELFDKIVELGHFTERDAAECIKNVCSALSYLHSHAIVHRDLKPENLLLRSKTSIVDVCICDFGYARVLGSLKRAMSMVVSTNLSSRRRTETCHVFFVAFHTSHDILSAFRIGNSRLRCS
jgi:serine/threonine protein kinase